MNKEYTNSESNKILWLIIIGLLIIIISVLHYNTPTMNWQYHLIYMQAYFIPILLGAFQFGIRGGFGAAVAVTILYFPHIMLHWGGLVEENLMRFLQIILFNVIGYLTGLKAQHEMQEKEHLQKLTKELDQNYIALKKQSQQLTEMEEQLRHTDRLAVIGELSASLAHEVRNPLGAIRGAVEIIKSEIPENSQQSEFADILIEEANRLNEVVENYLQFASKKKNKNIHYEIEEIIKHSVILLSNRADKKSVKISIATTHEPVTLFGDPTELRQIIINLILNALESIENNGEISIKVDKLMNKKKVSELQIIVSDTGKGMTKQELENIFKPFYTTKKEGSGLGLAIIKRICDSNNWKVIVNSIPDKGTEFKIIIALQ